MQRSPGWISRKDRHLVTIDAVAHHNNGGESAVKLTDFSEQGCRIESDDALRIGERLEIAIPRMGRVRAQIRWSLAGSAGARFLIDSDC